MKHWTNEEIAWVSEPVGGNPSEIIQQLQSRIKELDLENNYLNKCCAEFEAHIEQLEKQ